MTVHSTLSPISLFAIGLLLLITACGGQRAEPPAPAPAEEAPAAPQAERQGLTACDLLTPDDIEFVLGEAAPDSNLEGDECTFYFPPDGDGLRVPAVRLQLLLSSDTPEAMMERYTTMLRDQRGGTYEPVSLEDLGTAAAWDPQDGILTTALRNNGRTAFVLVQPMDIDAARAPEVARALAQQALERL